MDFFRIRFWLLESDKELEAKKKKKKTSETTNMLTLVSVFPTLSTIEDNRHQEHHNSEAVQTESKARSQGPGKALRMVLA